MTLPPGLTGALIAGGRSRRMGADKRLLVYDGATLLERAERLLGSVCGEVLLVSPAPPPLASEARHVPDRFEGLGVPGGIHAALCEARHPLVLCIAVDTPRLTAAWLELLARGCGEAGAPCAPRVGGRVHPLPACYPKSCLEAVESTLRAGGCAAKDLLAGLDARYVGEDEARAAGCDPAALENVNTPEDWARLVGATS